MAYLQPVNAYDPLGSIHHIAPSEDCSNEFPHNTAIPLIPNDIPLEATTAFEICAKKPRSLEGIVKHAGEEMIGMICNKDDALGRKVNGWVETTKVSVLPWSRL
jgi:hypothetical protein